MDAKEIIMMAIAVIMVGELIPVGLNSLYDANDTNWDPVIITVWQIVLPICVVLAIALKFLGYV